MILFSDFERIWPWYKKDQKFGWIDREGDSCNHLLVLIGPVDSLKMEKMKRPELLKVKTPFTIDRKGLCIANCPMSKDEEENAAWQQALRANTIGNYEIYLKQFPNGSRSSCCKKEDYGFKK